MIISNEQARLTAKELSVMQHSAPKYRTHSVPATVFDAAIRAASDAPEVRMDRVEQARAHLASGAVDAHAVAEKILARTICDHLG